MNSKSPYRFLLLSFLVVAGLMGSLTHYHYERTECLAHADEQHYVENNDTCPICTIVMSGVPDVELEQGIHFYDTELIAYRNEVPFNSGFINSDPGRAPPYLI